MSQPSPDEIANVVRNCPMCGNSVIVDDRQCNSCGETFDNRPKEKLHGLGSAVWAAIFGGLAGAGVVLAINYRRLGRTAAAWWVAIFAIAAACLAIFGFQFLVPEMPNLCVGLLQIAFAFIIANVLQGPRIRRHIRKGGQTASGWQGVGIGVLCGVALVTVAFGFDLAMETFSETTEVTIFFNENDDITYSGEATREDADNLAEFLKDAGLFGDEGASVWLEASSGKFTISFVLKTGAWNDPAAVTAYEELGREIAGSLFPPPLTIQLCDREFTVQKTIDVR